MNRALLLCVLGFCALGAANPSASLIAQQHFDICYFGDSITEGWMDAEKRPDYAFPALTDSLLRHAGHSFISANLGVGGETTEDALHRIDADILSHTPRIVVLSFGSNDWFVWGNPPFQRVPIEQYRRNLSLLFDKIIGSGAHLVLLGMPPVLEQRFYTFFDSTLYVPFGGVQAGNSRYADVGRVLARDRGIPYLNNDWGEAAAPLLGFDGVHPLPEGHRRIANGLVPLLLPLLTSTNPTVPASSVQLYPVPFQPLQHSRLIISLGCAASTEVELRIFDAAGREIRKIVYFAWSNGTHFIPWDGRTGNGTTAAQGAYTVTVRNGEFTSRHTLLIL